MSETKKEKHIQELKDLEKKIKKEEGSRTYMDEPDDKAALAAWEESIPQE